MGCQMDITEMNIFSDEDNQSTTSTDGDDLSFQLSVSSDTESRDEGQHGVNEGLGGVQDSGEAGSSVSAPAYLSSASEFASMDQHCCPFRWDLARQV